MIARIQNLDRVIGIVAGHTGDGLAGLGDYADTAISIGNVRIGIEQRFAQLRKRARPRDVGKIGAQKTAAAADHVAAGAAGFTVEEGASGLDIAGCGAVITEVRLRR